MLNHGPLFKSWTDNGFRVVSFDFPSHGESIGDSINDFDPASGPILGLAKLAFAVEQKYRRDPSRPLLIAGWSTGGLLAIRMAQGLGSYNGHRDISALILLAPGVFVRPIVGENGTVTLKTLTQDTFAPHIGKITPNRPAFEVTFAIDLLVNGRIASQQEFPNVPTLVVLGDEELDRYIFSKKTKTWTSELKANGRFISAIECPGALHELDNEGNGIGVEVRREVLKFVRKIVDLSSVAEPLSICQSF
jgi:alpha-beta hydrolase superfamily lysophospholipase